MEFSFLFGGAWSYVATAAWTAATLAPLVNQAGQTIVSECVSKYMGTQPQETLVNDFGAVVEELDVLAALETAHALVAAIQEKDEVGADWVIENPSDVQQVCITNLRAAMDLLQADLDAMKAATTKHNEKWFAGWRALDYKKHIAALEKHKRLFDIRFKTLLDIVAAMRKA
jgi:hypothetical protein